MIATNHGKQDVLAPLLEKNLHVSCDLPIKFNTDSLGTFSGEIERIGSSVEVLEKKARTCATFEKCDLIVASEGSFGPHPSSFFLSANEELLCLLDLKYDLKIIVSELTTDTNLSAFDFSSIPELLAFAEQSLFPSHGLILRKSKSDHCKQIKGIKTKKELIEHAEKLINAYGSGYAETDMRAYMNPTRMGVIERAGIKLIEKVLSECPNCSSPGFGITNARAGLPCKSCGSPTQSILSHIYSCVKCEFQTEKMFPKGKIYEDPMFCDHCNP